jgi:hypothetical protein
MPAFRGQPSGRRGKSKSTVIVSTPSAGFAHHYGYARNTLHSVNYTLHIKPQAAPTPPTTTTSSILKYAAGDITYQECFNNEDTEPLPEHDETPGSTEAGIRHETRKERNTNSVSMFCWLLSSLTRRTRTLQFSDGRRSFAHFLLIFLSVFTVRVGIGMRIQPAHPVKHPVPNIGAGIALALMPFAWNASRGGMNDLHCMSRRYC